MSNQTLNHSNIDFFCFFRPRDESGSVTIGTKAYILGGVGENTVEVYEMIQDGLEEEDKGWKLGPEMPAVIARGCAVMVDDNTIVIIGS